MSLRVNILPSGPQLLDGSYKKEKESWPRITNHKDMKVWHTKETLMQCDLKVTLKATV